MIDAIYIATLISMLLVLLATFSSLIALRFGAPLLLLFLGIGLALRAFLEIMVAAAAIGAAFGGGFGLQNRDHPQECTKGFPVAAIA